MSEDVGLTLGQLQRALRLARPSTEPGTYAPHRREAVKAMYVGWRYTVVKVADELDSRHFEFDRKAFNKACGAETDPFDRGTGE